jgi:3-oxoacyl-ACP reductase-like protein
MNRPKRPKSGEHPTEAVPGKSRATRDKPLWMTERDLSNRINQERVAQRQYRTQASQETRRVGGGAPVITTGATTGGARAAVLAKLALRCARRSW